MLAGRYRVEHELGRGGWGVVLAVVDERGRPFALKLLLHDATDEALRRFAREAEVIAALHSAHVCRIHDTGTLDDGSPFIVMDRLVGDDLDEVLRRGGPLPVPVAVDFVMQACDAIAEAHLAGVVHRDIKPSNLFLATTAQGDVVKVLDFGIAKARRIDLKSLTGTGTMLGSPYYMPPEQLVDSREVNAGADIWALGVTLFELVSGQPCFHGKDVGELFTAVLRDDPIPLAQVRPDAALALGQVIARCLEKLPEDRYTSVADLASALEPFGTDHGRVLAKRIRALAFRRAARPGDEPATPIGPVAVSHASTTTPSSPGSSTYDRALTPYPTYPGVTHTPSVDPQWSAQAPQPKRTRWGWAAAIASVAVVVVAATVATIVVVSSDADRSSGTKAPPSKPVALPAPCAAVVCDFELDETDPLDVEATVAQLTALAADRLAGKQLHSYTVMGLRADDTFDPMWGGVTGIFISPEEVVSIIVNARSTRVSMAPNGHPPMGSKSADGCPARRVVAEARKRHPNTELLQASLVLTHRAIWNVGPHMVSGKPPSWSLILAEDCAPP